MGMATNLTLDEMGTYLGELYAAMGRPFKLDSSEQVGVFYRVLRTFPTDWVRDGVRYWIAREEKLPVPSQLKRAIYDAQREKKEAPGGPTSTASAENRPPCPQCGHDSWFAGFEMGDGSVQALARCACPEVSARWRTEAALQWRETVRGAPRPPRGWNARTETIEGGVHA